MRLGKPLAGALQTIDRLVDLPFALPTAVAGIALATLYAKNGWIGRWLEPLGIEVAYTPLGVVVALTFIGLPFVVRTVQPVLADLDPEVEEAAASLGAGRLQTFRRVIFPELSEERRREYIKVARHKAEDSRVSIRNIRRHAKDSLDKLVKDGEAGEDEGRRAERELDELTHNYVGQIDELLRHKEAELLEV